MLVEELTLQVRPEFGQQIAADAAEQAGLQAAAHDAALYARARGVEIRGSDPQHHAENAGRVEHRPPGVLAGNYQAADRIQSAAGNAAAGTFAKVARILVQQAGQHARTEEVLGAEI